MTNVYGVYVIIESYVHSLKMYIKPIGLSFSITIFIYCYRKFYYKRVSEENKTYGMLAYECGCLYAYTESFQNNFKLLTEQRTSRITLFKYYRSYNQ